MRIGPIRVTRRTAWAVCTDPTRTHAGQEHAEMTRITSRDVAPVSRAWPVPGIRAN